MARFSTRYLIAALVVLATSAPAHALTELAGIAKIATGDVHTCAVTTGGGVKCWGASDYGKLGNSSYPNSPLPSDVTGLGSGVVAITAGYNHTCALTTGGGVYCWGYNDGRLGDNSTNQSAVPRGVSGLASGVKAIVAARSSTCALTTGGGVKCWGSDYPTGIDSLTPVDVAGLTSGVDAIAAGADHLCVTIGGGVKCWGSNSYGQLGDGGASGFSSPTPVSVTGLASGVTAIAAGSDHACAITTGGAVKCWGNNSYGQIGDNGVSGYQSPIPVGVSGLASGATAIATGNAHTCAVVAGGGARCWGRNSSGELGDNGVSGYQSPIPVDVSGLASGAVDIAAGGYHSCARTAGGGVKCWGANSSGQLGDNTTINRPVPVDVLSNAPLGQGASGRIAVGGTHTCRISSGGGAQCWGGNQFGQLGDFSTTTRLQPIDVSGLASGIAAVSAGDWHTCAVTSGGGAQCWGNNAYGQLGNNSITDYPRPEPVTGLASGVAAVALGALHTCALTSTGAVKCWGTNGNGQLGNNSTVDARVAVDVAGLSSGVKAVGLGSDHTCALSAAGGVKCWGSNAFGQAGGNAGLKSLVPVDVPGLATGVSAIAVGRSHNCAVTTSGGVKCWGFNGTGALGDLSTTNRPIPVDVPGLAGVAAVAAGGSHTCALTTAGSVKCWGSNGNGRLGNNSTVASFTPVDVVGLTSGVIAIGANVTNTCALTSAGSVKCWGDNSNGQLGNGGTAESHVPVDALLVRATPSVSVALVSGTNPSARGQSLTFYGIVTAAVPGLTGTVTFKDGGAIIPGCGATLLMDTSGSAPSYQQVYCTTAALSAGTHSITAEYSGNAEILGGVSPTHVQTVIAIDPFVFESQDSVGLGVLATSNPVTIGGFPGTQPISVSNGGRYSIGCVPPYLTASGTVTSGTVVCVHHVTPLVLGYGTTTTLTVGGVSSSFNSTTNYSSPLTPPANIAAGISHNLVIAPDAADGGTETIWAWGDNTAGKLGIGSTVSTTIPSKPYWGWVNNVAAGMSHSLALVSDGHVYAWGLNRNGQLGIDPLVYGSDSCKIAGEFGTFLCLLNPVQVQGLDNVVAISAGWGHSLALKSDGTVWAWGSGEYGQNGASSGDRVTPTQVPIGGMVTRIAAGYMHSVALLSDGTVVAWGQGSHGELGPATLVSKNPNPTVVTGLTGVTDIAAGGGYTLARKGDLSLVAWGSNTYATLGNSSAGGFVQAPAPVVGMTDVAEFTAGFGFALARKTGGGVFAWGLNNRGQLNGTAQSTPANCGLIGSRSCIRTPTQITSLGGATRLAAGGAHTLTVRPSRDLVIIGDNAVGQHADKSGNYGVPFSAGRQPFVQEVYDPDTFISPQGTFGSIGSIGRPSSNDPLNLGAMGDAIAFDPQGVGITSPALVLTLSNLSNTDTLNVTSVVAAGSAVANEYSASGCVGPLGPNNTCTIDVFFRPADLGDRFGTLTLQSDAANSGTLVLDLQGAGIDPRPVSTTTLASSANPSTAGASVTFTASVSAPVTPAGTVVFRSDGVAITGCTAVAVVSGSAACPTIALTAGTHGITAEYSGSPTVQPSTSSALTQTVLSTYLLTVTRQGAGSGTVTSSPAGVACGSTCSASYTSGTVVTLTPAPAAGSVFGGWSGECTGTGTCQVTMAGARNVVATFNQQSYVLTVTRAGAGTGTVTSTSPAGSINCGGTCSASFTAGTSVTLAQAPAAGSAFTGWSGACTGVGNCVVTMTQAQSVTAAFSVLQSTPTLSVDRAAIAFGGQSMNTTSPEQLVIVSNTGTGTLTITAVNLPAGAFARSHDCASLAAGASCTVRVTFTPPIAAGALNSSVPYAATLTVTSAENGSKTVELAGTGERSLVAHYYRSILLRAPDAGGAAYWAGEATRATSLGINVNEVWFAMAQAFYTSAEYAALNRDATGFITDLYNTFFSRAPDAGGLIYWVGNLNQGMPREVALAEFMFSAEFRNFAQVIFGNTAARAEVDAVVDFYRGLLARLPDDSGFNTWVGRFRTAQCSNPPSGRAAAIIAEMDAISDAFVKSAEYTARNRNNAQYVGDLYNAFLRRGGDLGGVQGWIAFVANPPALDPNELAGTGRERLRRRFVASAEFQVRVNAIIAQGCLP